MVVLNVRLLQLIPIVFLCSNLVQSAPQFGSYVPSRETYNYQLIPGGDVYYLRLNVPNYVPEQELSVVVTVTRTRNVYQPVTGYEVNENGYKYERPTPSPPKFIPPLRPAQPELTSLCGATLKLCSG